MAFDASYLMDWLTGVSPEDAAKKRVQGAPAGLGSGAAGQAQQALGGRKEHLDKKLQEAESGEKGKAKAGYQKGGFTGNKPVDEVAGPVHGQEYVIEADVVSFLGTRYFDKLVEQARTQMGQSQNPITQFDMSLDDEGV